MDLALRTRTRRDDLLRGFRGGLYAFDIIMDIGAYRDLHRHRRCQQFRQPYGDRAGICDAGGHHRGRPHCPLPIGDHSRVRRVWTVTRSGGRVHSALCHPLPLPV